jgi:signal transduction histidine kinase
VSIHHDEPRREPNDVDAAAVLAAVRDALVGVASDLSLDAVLEQLVRAARRLVGARYAALGVPDEDGGFSQFITDGMDDELIESLGPLPRTHGLLGAMLTSPAPYRTPDVRTDPRFRGWWPETHPQMRSFLGYPIVFKGDIVGAFYLTDKIDADEFDERDERLVGEFAPQAAVLVEFARLAAQSRELSVAGERDRIARELHDSLTQSLFGTRLALRTASLALSPERGRTAAAGHTTRDDGATAAVSEVTAQLDRATSFLDKAFDELRALVWDLRPLDLELDRLTGAVHKQLTLIERTSDLRVDFSVDGDRDAMADVLDDAESERQLFRIVQEAVTNAIRHASASKLTVTIGMGDQDPDAHERVLRVEVRDDGKGFDPDQQAVRSRRLGLTSMYERARAVGGRLTIESTPGNGTTVRVEVPID